MNHGFDFRCIVCVVSYSAKRVRCVAISYHEDSVDAPASPGLSRKSVESRGTQLYITTTCECAFPPTAPSISDREGCKSFHLKQSYQDTRGNSDITGGRHP
jgi:hypothetical protein